jgi:hypothetical protein
VCAYLWGRLASDATEAADSHTSEFDALMTAVQSAAPEADADASAFERVTDWLLWSLFDGKWYVRHGAALGLSAVLRSPCAVAAASGASVMGSSSAQRERWYSDVLSRVVCGLALDRYNDYSSGHSAVPVVRHAMALCLAAAVRTAPVQLVPHVLTHVLLLTVRVCN